MSEPLRGWRITKDFYDAKVKRWKKEQAQILKDMGEHKEADENYLLAQPMVVELSRNAFKIFKSSEPDEKRVLLNFLLQNCVLDGKKLHFNLKPPFDVILKYSKKQDWRGILNKARIYFEKNFS